MPLRDQQRLSAEARQQAQWRKKGKEYVHLENLSHLDTAFQISFEQTFWTGCLAP
jgi:hypothetical protein